MDQIPWTDIISNGGALALVVALVWYVFTKTIPRLASDFKEALADSRADYKEMAKQERDDFRSTLDDHREFFEKQVTAEHEQVSQVVEALREFSLRNGVH